MGTHNHLTLSVRRANSHNALCTGVAPYHGGSTSSRQITEVKHRRAEIVLGWGTAWELSVRYSGPILSASRIALKPLQCLT